MFRSPPNKHPKQYSPTVEERLQSLFNGLDGFGQILFFWALTVSLISAIILIAIGFAFLSGWAILFGLIAGRCYAYLGHIGFDILERILPYDG